MMLTIRDQNRIISIYHLISLFKIINSMLINWEKKECDITNVYILDLLYFNPFLYANFILKNL